MIRPLLALAAAANGAPFGSVDLNNVPVDYVITVMNEPPAQHDRRARFDIGNSNRIYEYAVSDKLWQDRRFIRTPRQKNDPWIEVAFFRAERSPDRTSWRQQPLHAFNSNDMRNVLRRITFSELSRSDCMELSIES